MKAHFLIPLLLIFAIFFTSCKQRTISISSADLDEISRQLEEHPREITKPSNQKINSNSHLLTNANALADTKIVAQENTSAKSKNHFSSQSKKSYNSRVTLLDKKEKQKIFSPKEFDTDNVFWRIGKIILKVGLTVMGLLGAISFGVSSNNGFLFSLFGGLLIGLIIMAISIPFFIIGLISELMKNRNSKLEDTNEI